jgi:hypothetical protein
VSPTRLGHVSTSSISPHGEISCNLETGQSEGEICDRLRSVEKS